MKHKGEYDLLCTIRDGMWVDGETGQPVTRNVCLQKTITDRGVDGSIILKCISANELST